MKREITISIEPSKETIFSSDVKIKKKIEAKIMLMYLKFKKSKNVFSSFRSFA